MMHNHSEISRPPRKYIRETLYYNTYISTPVTYFNLEKQRHLNDSGVIDNLLPQQGG